MPRGYSYDHFQVPKREPRERATPPDSLKAATAHKGGSVPLPESQEGLHYGRKNAETVKRLHERPQQRKAAAKAPIRGTKTLGRVAAAAKKSVKRVAKKVTASKASKRR
jgi:hypothetical protein